MTDQQIGQRQIQIDRWNFTRQLIVFRDRLDSEYNQLILDTTGTVEELNNANDQLNFIKTQINTLESLPDDKNYIEMTEDVILFFIIPNFYQYSQILKKQLEDTLAEKERQSSAES